MSGIERKEEKLRAQPLSRPDNQPVTVAVPQNPKIRIHGRAYPVNLLLLDPCLSIKHVVDFFYRLKKIILCPPADIPSVGFNKLAEKRNTFAAMLQINLTRMHFQTDSIKLRAYPADHRA